MKGRLIASRLSDTKIRQGAVHKRRRQLGGGEGSKIGPNCRRIVCTKKLPTWGRGVLKIWKNCRRHLWMVPKAFVNLCKSKRNFLSPFQIFFLGMKFRQNKQEHCRAAL